MLDAKLRNLSVIEATGAILIARVDEAEEAYQICRAAVEGGIRAVEVPLTVPCGDNLSVGASVVIDAPFGRYFSNERYLLEAKHDYGWPPARLVVVHVVTDGDIVLDRLRQRDEPRDEWKIHNWEQFWAGATATACRWLGADHVTVDNSGASPDFSGVKALHRRPAPVPSG